MQLARGSKARKGKDKRPSMSRYLGRNDIASTPLAAAWACPARWRLVLAGAWRNPTVIHELEARASLMALRRAARDRLSLDTIVLTIGDNLSEILAREKGRATSRELNVVCRKVCALSAATTV